ncbi:MAG: hypothetical protein P9L91_02190, partial [Candidatus Zophobacter franzmannii]|nr:hypothetical protein [Candidatus Zophobacter franzmannii]
MYLSCEQGNDLYQVLLDNNMPCHRFETPDQAVKQAPQSASVLILAQEYPLTATRIEPAVLDEAMRKNLRLYIEFPERITGIKLGSIQKAPLARCVVTSNLFGDALPAMRILAIHGCHFISSENKTPHLALAKVAGFDKAVFGLEGTTVHPLLFDHPDHTNILIATTRLSQCVTGRYAPTRSWQLIWRRILQWLDPELPDNPLTWTQTVRPTYAENDPLPADAQREAVIRGIDWHDNAKMLVHKSWSSELSKYGANNAVGPAPQPNWPIGDGTHGLLEGVHSGIDPSDGSQKIRWWLRTDCNGESSIAFALRGLIDGDTRSRMVAANLADWVYVNSGLFNNDDPSDGHYGLLGWAPDTRNRFYQDNDIKAILGIIGTAAVLKS